MSIAGNRTDVRVTQTNQDGKLNAAINGIEINGEGKFCTGVKVAQLSLKHRMNKSQRQRIIIFVGHPIHEEEAELEELGKRLRKNNVAIDIISFANPDNVPKLTKLCNAANKDNNSNFMDVPMGVTNITDVLISSPILMSDNAGGGDMGMGGGAGGPAANPFGDFGAVDPNLDPALADALRMSMEEQRDLQAKQPEEAAPKMDAVPEEEDEDAEMDEEEMLKQAIELSKKIDGEQEQEEKKEDENKDELKDILSTDFMKELVQDMKLDNINAEDIDKIHKDIHGDKEGEDKDKEDKDKKDEKKD